MLDKATQLQYQALARWLSKHTSGQRCPVIGVNGAQGSGKSTLCHHLVVELEQHYGKRAAVLSLDDCYLGHAAREQLALDIHPLLATRGVPGTHDVALGKRLLRKLQTLEAGETLSMPRFSKAEDDRLPEEQWHSITGPFDLILFEGWCVGTPPQTDAELVEPINDLERYEDADGRWRQYVNRRLQGCYADWFSMLDALVMLQIPGFEQVVVWRSQQEQETAASAGEGQGLMSEAQLHRFIQHYERLTRHALDVLPAQADVCLAFDANHSVIALSTQAGG